MRRFCGQQTQCALPASSRPLPCGGCAWPHAGAVLQIRCSPLVFLIQSSASSGCGLCILERETSGGLSCVSLPLSSAHQLGENMSSWHHGPSLCPLENVSDKTLYESMETPALFGHTVRGPFLNNAEQTLN